MYGLNRGMPESAVLSLAKPTFSASPEARERARQVERSIRQTLAQATKLKDISFQAAVDLAESTSSPEQSAESRARAQAIIALIKSWSEACTIVRITRGKPLPGSLRPESKPKKSKSKPLTFTEQA